MNKRFTVSYFSEQNKIILSVLELHMSVPHLTVAIKIAKLLPSCQKCVSFTA
jgi:hypothetical protein